MVPSKSEVGGDDLESEDESISVSETCSHRTLSQDLDSNEITSNQPEGRASQIITNNTTAIHTPNAIPSGENSCNNSDDTINESNKEPTLQLQEESSSDSSDSPNVSSFESFIPTANAQQPAFTDLENSVDSEGQENRIINIGPIVNLETIKEGEILEIPQELQTPREGLDRCSRSLFGDFFIGSQVSFLDLSYTWKICYSSYTLE